MKYTPTTWVIGDVITDVKANNWEKQYKDWQFESPSELTITSGAILPTKNFHRVDTESDAAADDLDTITATNATSGTPLILRAEIASRVVTIKNGTGNIICNGDYPLSTLKRWILLVFDGTNWREQTRQISHGHVYAKDGMIVPVGADKWVSTEQ